MNKDCFLQLHNTMKRFISEFGSVYDHVKATNDWKNSFRDIIRKTIPDLLRECAHIEAPYSVVGSYGKGRWTAVPWIAVFDTRITTSAQKGVYIVYLLNKDAKELYLTFESAATEVIHSGNDVSSSKAFVGIVGKLSSQVTDALQNRADNIRNVINDLYFSSDNAIDTGSEGYDAGAIYYKKYNLDSLPSGQDLTKDLQRMIGIYNRYYNKFNSDNDTLIIDDVIDEEVKERDNEVPISTREAITYIKDYFAFKGFNYPDGLIENFFLSLKSKPFVILAGTSGTGKTKMVKLFAEAINADYKLVSVRPDWSDGSDLFGHLNLNGNFVEGPVCSVFDAAISNSKKPVLLCLDEMNLARVEYYLSDFLSVIESREKNAYGSIVTEEIAQYKNGIPDNLYIIGTVNMDETTFPFSKKVLDRANTIEFSYVDLMPSFDVAITGNKQISLPNSFLRTEYLVLTKDCTSEIEYVREICSELQQINEILLKANAHVGYRVRDEIVFYMLNNKKGGYLLNHSQALDNEIMQKILPRIQGSSAAVHDMLCDLFKICAADHTQMIGNSDSEKMRKILMDQNIICKYRRSAIKLEMMVRRFEEDGFTSYWL